MTNRHNTPIHIIDQDIIILIPSNNPEPYPTKEHVFAEGPDFDLESAACLEGGAI